MLEFIRARQTKEENEEEEGIQQPNGSAWDQKEFLEFVKHYSEDETIPKEVKTSKWAIFGKALQYTFLNEKDLALVDDYANILRIDSLMNKPAHLLTFNEIQLLDQTQVYFWLTAKRAVGTDREKMNERTLQNTQITQALSMQVMNRQKASGGFMSKIRGML